MYIGLQIKYSFFLSDFLKRLEFSQQDFENPSDIKFLQNPSSGSRDDPCGRTERHDEANSRFSQFYKSVSKRSLGQNKVLCQLMSINCSG